jgi:hypothetical protein
MSEWLEQTYRMLPIETVQHESERLAEKIAQLEQKQELVNRVLNERLQQDVIVIQA